MELRKVKLTKQMAKAIAYTERECQRTNCEYIMPVHLLIGCIKQDSAIVEEAIHSSKIDLIELKNLSSIVQGEICGINYGHFNVPVSQETKQILDEAIRLMKGYNQIFLNEGHVLKALITSGNVDDLLTLEQRKSLLFHATETRDMLMNLSDYRCLALIYKNIRKARHSDYEKLIFFIENEFSGRWTESVKKGLDKDEPPIFLAFDQKENIVGFAAFDVVRYPGFFGPMGVAKGNRTKGIGYSLLHCCLNEMKMLGYTKIIIAGAGPIEFYERACNAQVIPYVE
jgi:N-acetylglutamate synthase-like GNAT family acetyltransferase